MAIEFSDDFEDGNFTEYGSQIGSPTIDSTAALNGALGFHSQGAAAQCWIGYTPNPASPTVAVYRIYFRMTAIPTGASAVVITARTASAQNCLIRVLNTTGVVQAVAGGGVAQSGPALNPNQRYLIEAKIDVSA